MVNKKRNILNIAFMIICFALTMYYVFHGEDLSKILHYMKIANSWYWLGGIVCVLAFIIGESVILYYLLHTLEQKPKFSHCCLYSFVGFFFCCITPSASGGQPVQALFMKRDGIPFHISTIVLLMITIVYKLVLIVYGLAVVIIRPARIIEMLNASIAWVYLGIVLNVIIVGFMILLAIKPYVTKVIVVWLFDVIHKITNSKRIEGYKLRAERAMDAYAVKSEVLLDNRDAMLKIFGITFIQRTILFATTYLVFLSFGIKNLGFVDVTAIQGLISVAVDMLPLPGGMGISEHLFLVIFKPALGPDLTVPAMIASRGMSYYTQLIISAGMTLVAYIRFFGKKGKE